MDRRRAAINGISRFAGAVFAVAALAGAADAAAKDAVARLAFGVVEDASRAPAAAFGGYAKGCLAGGEALPAVGVGYQTMRPSRNRAWGHPDLLGFIKDFSANLASEGYAPLLIGDLAQPRGGPMLSGHRSHQLGLDADIWFRPSPPYQLTREQREEWSAETVVASVNAPWVNERFTAREARMIELAAKDRRIARIFVGAPIKKALCEGTPASDRGWLRKVRPWYGHVYHMHVRLECPVGSLACKDQDPPAFDDGCGEELTSWLKPPKPVKPAPPPKPAVKPKEIMLSELPTECLNVLAAPSRR